MRGVRVRHRVLGRGPSLQPGSGTVGQAPAAGQVSLEPSSIRPDEQPQRGRVSLLSPSATRSPLPETPIWLLCSYSPMLVAAPTSYSSVPSHTEKGFCLEVTLWVKEWYIPASSERNKCFPRRAFLSPQEQVVSGLPFHSSSSALAPLVL